MERADAERAEFDLEHPLAWKVVTQPCRGVSSRRQERSHGLALEARQGVSEQRKRGGVQPLDVVDREHDGGLLRQASQDPHDGEREDALLDEPLGVVEGERGLKRALLAHGKVAQDLVGEGAEEVG